MTVLDRISHYLNQVLMLIAGLSLIAMIFLTCANIFLRVIWIPIMGTFELMGYFGAVLTAFALGYTQIKKGHIAVDIVVLGFSKTAQKVLNGINDLICMAFFAIVARQIAIYAGTLWRTGEITETLRIVYYPFTYAVALGCAILSLVFLTDFLKLVTKSRGDKA